jgi:HKD family nuclease
MPNRTSTTGSELFIVDNSDVDWKVVRYLHDWCQISKAIDCATGNFEIGALLALDNEWQKVDQFRILMGSEVTPRTKNAFLQALDETKRRLDTSIEVEKERNEFLKGVPDIVEGIRSGKIACRVYRKEKFHAKAYITHARMEVVGSAALVGSSNFSFPGLTENIELNVQITGRPVTVLQEWYEEHWAKAEDVTLDVLSVIERQIQAYSPFDVYTKALYEFFRGHEMTASEWEETRSKMFSKLDRYQKEAYWALMKIARQHGGSFLCDGVGLGKTFVGLMLIERLILHEGKRVVLFAPKAAKEAVWEPHLRDWLRPRT